MNFEDRTWTYNEKRMLRHMLEKDGMQFLRYFWRFREGNIMLRNWHHYAIEHVLQAVYDGKINRLIINIPPGYSKTEQAVINFIARGLALNPRSKFIHASYSSDLAHFNSSKIKSVIESSEFQELWQMTIKSDSKGKKMWFNEQGGGMLAAAAGGQITGFRAGRMQSGFTGAFIVDDPVKPDDAFSAVKRNQVNERYNNTMRTRLAIETVPMIVIMQRLQEDDFSGYLLKGGSADKWHHLVIPSNLTEECILKAYDKDYTHGIKIDLERLVENIANGENYDFAK